jgi:hypothetical protein
MDAGFENLVLAATEDRQYSSPSNYTRVQGPCLGWTLDRWPFIIAENPEVSCGRDFEDGFR